MADIEYDVQEPPRKLGGMLMRLGPGLIIAGSIVGSGELIATTKVGAEAGFALLWLIIVGCAIKVFVQVEIGRYTVTYGETALHGLNRAPGPWFGWSSGDPERRRWHGANWIVWVWAIATILVIGQQGGIVGGVGESLAIAVPVTDYGRTYNANQNEVTRAKVELQVERRRVMQAQVETSPQLVELEQRAAMLSEKWSDMKKPADPYIWAGLAAAVTSVLLYFGRYGLIQVVATVLVALFTLTTIVTVIALQAQDAWAITGAELWSGVKPNLPPPTPRGNALATGLAAFGIIGVGAFELIMYPYWCLEKGYAKFTGPRDGAGWSERARGWMRVMRLDAWGSMVVYTFATIAFYLLGAAVLWRTHLDPADKDMVRTLSQMYVPVFGDWADEVFLVGAFAVLYSTFFVAAAGNARMVADGMGLMGLVKRDEKSRLLWSRRVSAVWPLLAFGLLMGFKSPVAMVLASGIAQAIMLPMLGFAAMWFRYRRSDAALRPGRLWDALLWLSVLGFFIAGAWALYTELSKAWG